MLALLYAVAEEADRVNQTTAVDEEADRPAFRFGRRTLSCRVGTLDRANGVSPINVHMNSISYS